MLGRTQAYRRAFQKHDDGTFGLDGQRVLADLAKFCRARKPTTVVGRNGQVDPIATALAEGRREVWLRISEMLHLDERTIVNLQETRDDA